MSSSIFDCCVVNSYLSSLKRHLTTDKGTYYKVMDVTTDKVMDVQCRIGSSDGSHEERKMF